jgi:hypothetical protein
VHQLEVQMDSSIVVASIQHGKIVSAKGCSVWISHIYREANRCVDVLANLGCVSQHWLHVLNDFLLG